MGRGEGEGGYSSASAQIVFFVDKHPLHRQKVIHTTFLLLVLLLLVYGTKCLLNLIGFHKSTENQLGFNRVLVSVE